MPSSMMGSTISKYCCPYQPTDCIYKFCCCYLFSSFPLLLGSRGMHNKYIIMYKYINILRGCICLFELERLHIANPVSFCVSTYTRISGFILQTLLKSTILSILF
jgi:hypothetical protein